MGGDKQLGWVALFPGQGSQAIGMGQQLAQESAAARQALLEAEQVTGLPLRQWMWEGDGQELKRTSHTQPALLAVELAYLAAASERGCELAAAAGHSVGEYAALVAAGMLTAAEALHLVQLRGALMEEAVAPGLGGMMAIIGLTNEQVIEVCRQAQQATGELADAANFNCPGQVVVAGTAKALAALRELARAAGARLVKPLEVSGPFHSALMRAAAERLLPALAAVRWQPARIPVISNVRGRPYAAADMPAQLLSEQMWQPVRWTDSMLGLYELGYRRFVELGPGTVLSGLLRRTLANQSFLVTQGDEWIKTRGEGGSTCGSEN